MVKPLSASQRKSLKQRLSSKQSKQLYSQKHVNPIKNKEMLDEIRNRLTSK